MSAKTSRMVERFGAFELAICQLSNAGLRYRGVEPFFRYVSRLGDGVFWYAMMVTLPIIYGTPAWTASLHMGAVGASGVLVYKLAKVLTARQRPYTRSHDIHMGCPPLDTYSFPSGHTLHAVGFTTVLAAYYPELLWLTLPFAALVALSRVILGLHYPTDVIAGALIGLTIAKSSFILTG